MVIYDKTHKMILRFLGDYTAGIYSFFMGGAELLCYNINEDHPARKETL